LAAHLTVSNSTTSGQSVSRIFSAPGADNDVASAPFAALLDAAHHADRPERTHQASPRISAADKGAADNDRDDESSAVDQADAVAAVLDGFVPHTVPELAKEVFGDLVDGLNTLKAALDAGQPIAPELLATLNAKLDALGQMLGLDLSAVPEMSALSALLSQPATADADFAAQLNKALGPLALNLQEQAANAAPDLSEAIKSFGDKLAALLKAINDGDEAAQKLAMAAAGEDGTSIDVEVQAALAKLSQAMTMVETDPAKAALAQPQLETDEASLTLKPAGEGRSGRDDHFSTPADTARPVTGANNTATGFAGANDNGENTAGAAAMTGEDTQIDPTLAAQQTPAARVDLAGAPRVVQAGYQTSQQQLNLPQIAFEIVRQVSEGFSRFHIRLDPPEMGRIDVKLDIAASGHITARLTVEKAETLDLMQRDQRALQQALQQAGLDGAKTSLEFSLKQNPFSGGQGQQQDERGNPIFSDDTDLAETPPPTVNLYRGNLSASGVNIFA
jgi:flagellar hook-length control protein FliK